MPPPHSQAALEPATIFSALSHSAAVQPGVHEVEAIKTAALERNRTAIARMRCFVLAGVIALFCAAALMGGLIATLANRSHGQPAPQLERIPLGSLTPHGSGVLQGHAVARGLQEVHARVSASNGTGRTVESGEFTVTVGSGSSSITMNFTFSIFYASMDELPSDSFVTEMRNSTAVEVVDGDQSKAYECAGESCSLVTEQRRRMSLGSPRPILGSIGSVVQSEDPVKHWSCCMPICTETYQSVQERVVTWACFPTAQLLCRFDNPSDTAACYQAFDTVCPTYTGAQTDLTETIEEAGQQYKVVMEERFADSPELIRTLNERISGLVGDVISASAPVPYATIRSIAAFKRVAFCSRTCINALCFGVRLVGNVYQQSCFPGDSTVTVQGPSSTSIPLPMAQLSVGDMVLTPRGYEPVYFQGHADRRANLYIIFRLQSNHSLEVSPDHYVQLSSGKHLLAKYVRVGQSLLVGSSDKMQSSSIDRIERGIRHGAYNPYTSSGEIIVNGVKASCHSSWFLEGSSLVSPERVPMIYQVLLAPLRALHAAAPERVGAFCRGFDGDHRAMSDLSAVEYARGLMQVISA